MPRLSRRRFYIPRLKLLASTLNPRSVKVGLTATHFPAQRARALLTMIALFAALMAARMEVFAANPNLVFDAWFLH